MTTSEKSTGCLILLLLFWLYAISAWIVNLMKLLDCDFAAPYKEEVIHLIGLIPVVSIFTCWY